MIRYVSRIRIAGGGAIPPPFFISPKMDMHIFFINFAEN
jgi:hypothetical protein